MKRDKTEELLLRAKSCDGDAFVELMELHKQSMYKVAKAYLKREEDVADAISETILDCFEHLESLRETRYFGTWLVRILINNCNNIRKSNNRTEYIGQIEILAEGQRTDARTSSFLDYLEPLEEEDRLIMILFYVWGFRTREISELLHIKEATINSRMQRGRQKIKQAFFPMVV